jgi:formiminoglutamate deiminase
VFYAHSGFGGATPTEAQRRFICDPADYVRLHEASGAALAGLPDAVLGVAPHSLRAVTPQELAEIGALAGSSPIHIHVAEQVAEIEACIGWSGARPVEWLLANAPVGANWCLVHATHMTEAETVTLASSGAVAGLCPVTEANLGDGLFPAPGYLEAGGQFGIGSDSNVMIDTSEELRWLEYGQRLGLKARNVIAEGPGASTGGTLLRRALAGGAQALGAPVGIAPGRSADFVTLEAQHPALCGARGDGWLDGWIFAAGRGAIDGVWRRGARVVAGGRHHRRARISARYRATLGRLLA